MKRFILDKGPDKDGLIRVWGEGYHYLVHVRRLKPGGVFAAALPSGEEVTARVQSVEGGVLAALTGPAGAAVSSPALPPLVLFQALPKGTKMDLIVRQAAEGGISEVVPFVAERSVPGRDTGGGKRAAGREPAGGNSPRLERWRRIVKEARQQSGSPVDTQIRPVVSAAGLFARWDELRSGGGGLAASPALGIVLHETAPEGPGESPLEQSSFHHYLSRGPSAVALAVGPEGGFSPLELERFTGAGFKLLRAGNTVLRTETAALYGAAAVRIILLERAWWTLK
ncbi:MAG: RsmE family RNA methyltransferase [Treponema sp.]|jgi:16S rRNA (uracil1498-N3)-methyltransferase|nr:RsmE family RNA methyltransferase [Treponema sp.]